MEWSKQANKEKENRREPIKKKKKKTIEFLRRLKNQDSGVKNLPANAGHTGSIPDPGRFHMPRGS